MVVLSNVEDNDKKENFFKDNDFDNGIVIFNKDQNKIKVNKKNILNLKLTENIEGDFKEDVLELNLIIKVKKVQKESKKKI